MAYLEPKSLDHALEILARARVSLIAGGTDFFPAKSDGAVTGDLLDLTIDPPDLSVYSIGEKND